MQDLKSLRQDRWLSAVLVAALAIPALSQKPDEIPVAMTASRPPLLQCIADISLGQTDKEVQAKYGKGALSDFYGHIGGRVFVSRKRSYTVVFSIGQGWVVEDILIAEGVQLPEDVKEVTAVCRRLPKKPHIDLGIRLGAGESEIISILGTPLERKDEGGTVTLVYNAEYENDDRVGLYYDARYEFKDGRLVSISIHDGE